MAMGVVAAVTAMGMGVETAAVTAMATVMTTTTMTIDPGLLNPYLLPFPARL
jgi:hypothetical protein